MPAKNIVLDTFATAVVVDGSSHLTTYEDDVNGEIFFNREFRSTTSRNTPPKEKKFRPCLRPPKLALKESKPKRIKGLPAIGTNKFGVPFLLDRWAPKYDLRAERYFVKPDKAVPRSFSLKELNKPMVTTQQFKIVDGKLRVIDVAPKLPEPPKGYLIKDVPDGTFYLERRVVGSLGRKVTRWVPRTVKRLVKINRRRGNPNKALNALTNDLLYYKQWISGLDTYAVCLDVSTPVGTTYPLSTNSWLGEGQGFCVPDIGFGRPALSPNEAVPLPLELPNIHANVIKRLQLTALRRHYDNIASKKVDLATALAEGVQTVNMIADSAKRIAEFLIKLKKLRLVDAFSTLFPKNWKQLANDYLAFQYGIKPLFGDVQAAAEQVAEWILRLEPVKSSGRARAKLHQDSAYSSGLFEGRLVTDTEIRVKYGTYFRVSDDLTRMATQLGFTNPANVVWELVPFSFVWDWFLPIGKFLNSLTALNGLQVKESYRTVFIKRKDTFFAAADPSRPYGVYWSSQGSVQTWTVETIYCKREVIPLPDVPKPTFKSPFSLQHIANAVALFTQLISKR